MNNSEGISTSSLSNPDDDHIKNTILTTSFPVLVTNAPIEELITCNSIPEDQLAQLNDPFHINNDKSNRTRSLSSYRSSQSLLSRSRPWDTKSITSNSSTSSRRRRNSQSGMCRNPFARRIPYRRRDSDNKTTPIIRGLYIPGRPFTNYKAGTKKASRYLRKNERYKCISYKDPSIPAPFLKILEDANAPVVGVNADGFVTLWNRKMETITGFDANFVIGHRFHEFIVGAPGKNAVEPTLLRAFCDRRSTLDVNIPFRTSTTGRIAYISTSVTPLVAEHDTDPIGFYGVGQDVTEKRVIERQYARVIGQKNAAIIEVDKNANITAWNVKAVSLTGYPRANVLGKSLLSMVEDKAKASVKKYIERCLETGMTSGDFLLPLITAHSSRAEMILCFTPRFDHSGAVVGVGAIGQDVAEQNAQEMGSQEMEPMESIDNSDAPIFGVDIAGKIDVFNTQAVETTEYDREAVLGQDLIQKLIPEEYRPQVAEVFEKGQRGVETTNFPFMLLTRTGRRVEFLLNAMPRYDEEGKVMGVMGIGQDIAVLLTQEKEYSRLIDSANAPIIGVNTQGFVNIWNNKATEITQFSLKEVIGKDLVKTLVSKERRVEVGFAFRKALQGDQTNNVKFPLITKTGRRVAILLNATPRFNELGRIVGVVGVGQDMTEQIAREDEYARMIDTANAPIFGVDEEGRVNIWNKNAAEITQYGRSDVMGVKVETFITEDCRDAVRRVLAKALDGIETSSFEFPLITKTGRRVDILLNATPRYDEHSNVIGMVGVGQDITDRITQEQEYSRLIDKANVPIFGVNTEGRLNIWNQKVAEMTQFPTEQAMGELLVNFVAKEYRDAVATVLAKALKGDESANIEAHLDTKSGRTVSILLNATARFDQHGTIVGVVSIGQDMTDLIAAEQEYTRVIDTANAPIFGVDEKGCVNIWNKKAAQLTMYSIKEVMGENLVETFISPEYRPSVAEVLSKALQGIETTNFEFPLITRPGTRIEILLNATPRNDSNGNIVGVVGIGQDITDRIAQEHEYFRLIDTANAPILGVDTNGCINEWNQKIGEITGYAKPQVLGLSLVHTFIVPESRELVRESLDQALYGLDVGEMELPMMTKKGNVLLLLVNASSKRDSHGNILGVIGVGQDYTARKQMEEAKVNFLASFSHELRTPLNGVLGMLEMLKELKLGHPAERYVRIAYVSGSLLLNLINDILDLSKIEAGHLEIMSAPFQMNDLLDYSIEIFKFKASESGLLLKTYLDPALPKVVIGDVGRLRQVLLNLLSNAVKFTNNGSITVKCGVVHAPDLPKTFKKLLFQIIDTGIGMDVEEKSRLFSLFTKLERTRPNNPTGSGLGLAICKQLVEMMGGEIDVDSELGIGSNFFFTVVVQMANEDEFRDYFLDYNSMQDSQGLVNDKPNGKLGPPKSNGTMPSQARILVVEDNEFNWEVVKCFLQEDNHYLQWEVNGEEAVRAFKKNPQQFDLIFMDCEMPVMDGYMATGLIRRYESEHNLPRTPILGLTAYAMSDDRQKCLEAGMDEFMVKPITKASVQKIIRLWMQKRYQILSTFSTLPRSRSSQDLDYSTPPSSSMVSRSRNGTTISTSSDSFGNSNIQPVLTGSYTQLALTSNSSNFIESSTSPNLKLAPASCHMQQLDLDRAFSNLELEDPSTIGKRSGKKELQHSVFTGTNPRRSKTIPIKSIFSVGTPAEKNRAHNITKRSTIALTRSALRASKSHVAERKQSESSLSLHLMATTHDSSTTGSSDDATSTTLPHEFPYQYCDVHERLSDGIQSEGEKPPLMDEKCNDLSLLNMKNGIPTHNPTGWSHPPFPARSSDRDGIPSISETQQQTNHDVSDLNSPFKDLVTQLSPPQMLFEDPLSQISRERQIAGDNTTSILYKVDNDIQSQISLSVPTGMESQIPITLKLNAGGELEYDITSASSLNHPSSIVIPEGDPVNNSLGVEQCGDEELFLRLLEQFALGCEIAMTRIDRAYQTGNLDGVRREAHSLKGSSAYVAALRISKSAYRLQLACEYVKRNEGRSPEEVMESRKCLTESLARLRKETNLLRGYLERNYTFEGMSRRSASNPDYDRNRENSASPCSIM